MRSRLAFCTVLAWLAAIALLIPATGQLVQQAGAGNGTAAITSVTDNGNDTYNLVVASTSGMTVGDHFGAVVADGSGGVWAITSIASATQLVLGDTLTEEEGSEFGAPSAGVTGWYATPTTNLGLSLPPYTAKGWDAPLRRTAFVIDSQGIFGIAKTDGNFIVGNGSAWVAESGATARTSLGLGTISTQAASSVSITGGSITGITDLAIADGGTGASTAADARSTLGLQIGTDVLAYNSVVQSLAGITTATLGAMYYFDGTQLQNLEPGTSGYFLRTNGPLAAPTWVASPASTNQTLASDFATVTVSSQASYASIATYTVTAGELADDGDYLLIECGGTFDNDAGGTDGAIIFTYTGGGAYGYDPLPSAGAGRWRARIRVVRVGATNIDVFSEWSTISSAGPASVSMTMPQGLGAALTLSSSFDIWIKAKEADATDDVKLEYFTVTKWEAP